MNQGDESASVLSTQQFRHHVCPSFSTLWYDTLISLAYPPPTHTHTHTLVSLHAMCHSMSGNRAATLWRDEGEDFTLTPDSSHTFLTLWQLNDNTVNLAVSTVYEEDIFLMGKKRTPCKIIRCQVRGAKWKQRPVTAVIFTSDVCWKEFMLSLHYNLHKCHTRCCAWRQNKNSKLSVWI